MDSELLKKFETLAYCHKDGLIESAHSNDHVIWINLCDIYGIRDKETSLKEYILSQASAKRN